MVDERRFLLSLLTFLPLQDEVRRWILPGVSEDPIQSETNHLMKIGDDDKVMTSSKLVTTVD